MSRPKRSALRHEPHHSHCRNQPQDARVFRMTDEQLLQWVREQFCRFGLTADTVEFDHMSDTLLVRLTDAQIVPVSGKHLRLGNLGGQLTEGAIRCQDCKKLRRVDSFNWCRYQSGDDWRSCCPRCYEKLTAAPDVDRRWWRNQQAEAASNMGAFQANMRAEIDAMHRQADLAEQQLASGQWGNHDAMANAQAKLLEMLQSGQFQAGGSTADSSGQVEPPRPVCALCPQELVDPDRFYWDSKRLCGDCAATVDTVLHGQSIDTRIAAARTEAADPTSDWTAWAHPSAEGESW